MRCVSMPILDRAGHPVGAISISGTSAKQPGRELDRMVELLTEACGHVSRRLGFAGLYPPPVADEAGLRGRPEPGRRPCGSHG